MIFNIAKCIIKILKVLINFQKNPNYRKKSTKHYFRRIIMNKKLINLGIGVLTGVLGGKILSSQTVKKIAVSTVAGGLKVKEEIDKTIENVKVSTEDIIAEAKVKKAEDEKKEAERKAQLDIEKVAEAEETEVVEDK